MMIARWLWGRLSNDLRWRVQRLTQPTFLVGVSAVALDERGAVLLVRHRYWRSQAWALPGGYLRPRETFEDALRREIREETGLSVTPERLTRVASGFRYRVEVMYRCRLAAGEPRPDGREVSAARCFPLDELPAELHPQHRGWIALAMRDRE